MIHKSFSAETKVLDPAKGLVDAVFSVTNNVDRQGDKILPGAFRKALAAKASVPVVYGHSWDRLEAVLGKTVRWAEMMPGSPDLPPSLQSKGYGGVRATVQFEMGVPAGQAAFVHVKNGNITSWSFAFDIDDGGEEYKNNVREIKSVREIFECSVALIGANPEAMTLAVQKTLAMQGRVGGEWAKTWSYIVATRKAEARASIAANPFLAEAAAEILLAPEDRRRKVFLEFAESGTLDRGLEIAIHESGHAAAAQRHGLAPTAIKLHRNATGGCDTPGGMISPIDNAAIDLAGVLAVEVLGFGGQRLNPVDAQLPGSLTRADRETAAQSARATLAANYALVATLALALYGKAKSNGWEGVVSGREIRDISDMVDHLKDLPRFELQKVAADLWSKRLGFSA